MKFENVSKRPDSTSHDIFAALRAPLQSARVLVPIVSVLASGASQAQTSAAPQPATELLDSTPSRPSVATYDRPGVNPLIQGEYEIAFAAQGRHMRTVKVMRDAKEGNVGAVVVEPEFSLMERGQALNGLPKIVQSVVEEKYGTSSVYHVELQARLLTPGIDDFVRNQLVNFNSNYGIFRDNKAGIAVHRSTIIHAAARLEDRVTKELFGIAETGSLRNEQYANVSFVMSGPQLERFQASAEAGRAQVVWSYYDRNNYVERSRLSTNATQRLSQDVRGLFTSEQLNGTAPITPLEKQAFERALTTEITTVLETEGLGRTVNFVTNLIDGSSLISSIFRDEQQFVRIDMLSEAQRTQLAKFLEPYHMSKATEREEVSEQVEIREREKTKTKGGSIGGGVVIKGLGLNGSGSITVSERDLERLAKNDGLVFRIVETEEGRLAHDISITKIDSVALSTVIQFSATAVHYETDEHYLIDSPVPLEFTSSFADEWLSVQPIEESLPAENARLRAELKISREANDELRQRVVDLDKDLTKEKELRAADNLASNKKIKALENSVAALKSQLEAAIRNPGKGY